MSNFNALALSEIRKAIKQDFPQFKEVYKEDVWFMRALTRIFHVFGVPFEDFITTIGYTVYASREVSLEKEYWVALAHEWVHMHQTRELGWPLFAALYLFPQSLVLLSVLTVVGIWSPLFFLNAFWLLCALPLPSYPRMRYELEAYTMSMEAQILKHGWIPPDQLRKYKRQFYTANYYFMWPFKGAVDKLFADNLWGLENGFFCAQYPFKDVQDLIKKLASK